MPADTKAGPQPPHRTVRSSHPHPDSGSAHTAFFKRASDQRPSVVLRRFRKKKPRCDRKSWWAGGRRGTSASTEGEALSFGICKPGKVKKCTVTDLGAYQAHRSQFERSPTAKSSSEDEVDVLLHGTPDQKRKLIRECLTGESESSSEDEFEKEMEAELNSTIKTMEDKLSSLETGSSGDGIVGTAPTKYYDNIYFDSDSEDEDKAAQVTKKKKKKQHRIPTNDELLYDPEKDNRDQAWVDAQRRGYHGFGIQRPRQQQQPVPNSDAVLNCPACMTTLCLDCQRHESYKTQYRAMFVMNCSVNKEEILRYKPPENRKKRRGHKKMRSNQEGAAEEAETDVEEIYHPVMCTECSTEVAVYDKDEVFHFFNVLASHS